jgi:hypothetical protein
VESDYQFLNLNSVTFNWQLTQFDAGGTSAGHTVVAAGTATTGSIAPGASGTLTLALRANWSSADALQLDAIDSARDSDRALDMGDQYARASAGNDVNARSTARATLRTFIGRACAPAKGRSCSCSITRTPSCACTLRPTERARDRDRGSPNWRPLLPARDLGYRRQVPGCSRARASEPTSDLERHVRGHPAHALRRHSASRLALSWAVLEARSRSSERPRATRNRRDWRMLSTT